MIDRICLLLEALSVVICLHHLYGEKFRLDIKTVGFLAVDMIIMEFINHYELSKSYTMVIYPIIVIYCGLRFGFKVRELIVNNMLCIAIVGMIQFGVVLIYCYVRGVHFLSSDELLLVNSIAYIIFIIFVPKLRLSILSLYLQNKERLLVISLVVSILLTIYCVVNYKMINEFELKQYALFFVSIALICVLAMQLSKMKLKAKEIEIELKMQKLYSDSFGNIIDTIRMRQHEFDNHINTIYSHHYTYHTYQELVNAQKNYCETLQKENHFNKILSKGNPVIICFLYGKFMEIEKLGIKVEYKINIEELDIGVPVYKIVEILGNLIDNAIEAMTQIKEDKELYVAIVENDNLMIEVRNVGDFIAHEDIAHFFDKGFSKKGKNRGLGLYNVKRICEEYAIDILCYNKKQNNKNWITFELKN